MIFLVALAFSDAAPPAPLPAPPAVVAPAPARPAPAPLPALQGPQGGQVTTGPVACDQPLGCGTTDPKPEVEVDTHDGFSASTSPAWDRGAVTRAPDYSARLDAQLCEVKPVFCS